MRFFSRCALVLMFSMAFCPGGTAWGEDGVFTGQEEILRGLHSSYRLRFSEAREIFSKLVTDHPASPAGTFYSAAIDSGMTESDVRWRHVARLYAGSEPPKREVRKADEMTKNLNNAIDRCKTILRKNPDDFEALFYMAGSYAFLARMEAYRYNFLSAMVYGKKSTGYFDTLLERHPDRGDAMIGPGVYRYYVGRLSKPMRMLVWMLGLSGTKEEGMRLITRAHDTALLSKTEAADFMARICWLYDPDYAKALQWADALEREMPDAPLADFTRLFVYHNTQNLPDEGKTLLLLKQKLQDTDPEARRDWEPLILFALGSVNLKLGNGVEAQKNLATALALSKANPWLANEISSLSKTAAPPGGSPKRPEK